MRRFIGTALLGLAASALMFGQAPAYTIKTVAGALQPLNATLGNTIVFSGISAILPDDKGNIYIADFNGHRVWKLDANGKSSIVIGTNANNTLTPAVGKAANTTAISAPAGLALDAAGNLYVSDTANNKIFKIDTAALLAMAGRR